MSSRGLLRRTPQRSASPGPTASSRTWSHSTSATWDRAPDGAAPSAQAQLPEPVDEDPPGDRLAEAVIDAGARRGGHGPDVQRLADHQDVGLGSEAAAAQDLHQAHRLAGMSGPIDDHQ